MNPVCPSCHHDLTPINAELECQVCQKIYVKQSFCPKCHSELEKLQACGAVSFFCQTCNELKSKSQVIHKLRLKP